MVSCQQCAHNVDDAHTSTCKLSGVTTRKDYQPTICYGFVPSCYPCALAAEHGKIMCRGCDGQ